MFGADGAPMMCGSSQLVENGTLGLDVKRTYNADGMLVRAQRHFNEPRNTFTIGNPATGKTISNPGHWTETFDFTDPSTLTITGNFFQVTAPGMGAIYFDVGRIVFPVEGPALFEAGPKFFFDNGSLAALCAALT